MAAPVLVLGIGNILCGDDAFGVAAQARLAEGWRLPDSVAVMDGGTQGIYLLPHLQAAERLLLLDAIDFGKPPGALVVLRDGDIPLRLAQASAHHGGVPEMLALAGLLGWTPRAVALVGGQVGRVGLGDAMTPDLEARLDEAAGLAAGLLAEWGCPATPVGGQA